MFTGLIADVGRIVALTRRADGARLAVETGLDLSRLREGDSVAVDGACLTVLALGRGRFEADVSRETLERTTLARAKVGARVNLEPALAVGDPLGGHLVQGHVDGIGSLVARDRVGDGFEISYQLPEETLDTVVGKGSIALDGISLTVVRLEGARITVAVVPHTAGRTNLMEKPLGSAVNVETDVIGKYVLRILSRLGDRPGGGGLTLESLRKAGFA